MTRTRTAKFSMAHAAALVALIAVASSLPPVSADVVEADTSLLHKATQWITHGAECDTPKLLDV